MKESVLIDTGIWIDRQETRKIKGADTIVNVYIINPHYFEDVMVTKDTVGP
jgi:hypothetical protein